MKISKETATAFSNLCIGDYAGHMGMVPHNPTIQAFVSAHRALEPKEFANFLRAVADALETDDRF